MTQKALIILLLIALFSCTNSEVAFEQKEDNENVLTPPLRVTIDQLMSMGYQKLDTMNILTKNLGSANISYVFLNDVEPIFSRTVTVLNIDSTKVFDWVGTNNGLVCSEWQKTLRNKYRFYIRDRDSGLLLQAVHYNNILVITFDYPDLNEGIRSSHRKIDRDGRVIITGRNNLGEMVTIQH